MLQMLIVCLLLLWLLGMLTAHTLGGLVHVLLLVAIVVVLVRLINGPRL